MAENDQIQGAQQAQADNQPFFSVQRFYLKDASFEAPNTPEVFRQLQSGYQPQINFNINNRSKKLDDDHFEVALRLTADVKQEDTTLFLVEVEQAGIFQARNIEEARMEQILNITCPNLLFPYAKEAMENLVIKANFPPLMLAPVNFELIYNQAKQQQAQGGQPGAEQQPTQ